MTNGTEIDWIRLPFVVTRSNVGESLTSTSQKWPRKFQTLCRIRVLPVCIYSTSYKSKAGNTCAVYRNIPMRKPFVVVHAATPGPRWAHPPINWKTYEAQRHLFFNQSVQNQDVNFSFFPTGHTIYLDHNADIIVSAPTRPYVVPLLL